MCKFVQDVLAVTAEESPLWEFCFITKVRESLNFAMTFRHAIQ